MFNQPHIDYLELPCERLGRGFDGLTVLHLSDLHITRWTRRLGQWREALSAFKGGVKPDVVVITGDLGHRSWMWKTSVVSVQKLLEPLMPRLGTYFILGNHDSVKLGPALAETVDGAGGRRVLLQNETVFLRVNGKGIEVEVPGERDESKSGMLSGRADVQAESEGLDAAEHGTRGGARVAVIGVHQHRRIDTDIPLAMRRGGVRPEDFKLMLLHYPDLVHPATAAGADICLAGHTHGGQICWPDGRPLFRQDTLAPAMCTGVHRVNGTWMVVNRGIGAAGLKMRLFCPPHAVLMTLRAGATRAL